MRLREIDAKYEKASSLPAINLSKIAHLARKAASKRKSDELAQKRERLLELQQCHRATSADETESTDEGNARSVLELSHTNSTRISVHTGAPATSWVMSSFSTIRQS